MRSADLDILIVPGWSNSGPEHWQSRWEAKLSTARRVAHENWERPQRDIWVPHILDHIARATEPVLIIAHSLGVHAVAHAARDFPAGKVAGLYLVAPPGLDEGGFAPPEFETFVPVMSAPLGVPAALIASRNDPWCAYERSEELAGLWGARLIDAGESGHINTASGHGPWPEGLMSFAGFLKDLKKP
jgi:hypothetical protein